MRTVKPTAFPNHPTVDDPEDIGRIVRAVRTAAGMTLEETALAIQVAKQTLQNVENGRGTVSLELVFRILAGLGIQLRWQAPGEAGPDTTGKDAAHAP